MIEFLFSLVLELILISLVIFVIIVYLQRSTMESIWGDPLDDTGELTSYLENLDSTGEIDEEYYQDIPENTYDDGGLHLIEGDSKSSAFDKADLENKSYKRQNVVYPTSDDENLNCNEVNSESTTSEDKYLSADEDHLITASAQNELENITLDDEGTSCSKVNSSTTDKELSCNNPFSCFSALCCGNNNQQNCDAEDLKNKVNSKSTTAKVNIDKAESITSQPDKENANSSVIDKAESKIDKAESKIDNAERIIDKAESKSENEEFYKDNSAAQIDIFDISKDKSEKYIISVPIFTSVRENETDSLIKVVDLSNKMSRVYDVNGVSFVESELMSQHDNDELKEYQLYQVDKTEDDDDEDMITTLDMHIQKLPQGVIINSNVFLWDAQWHTMALVDQQLFRCSMCQVFCDRLTCEDHVDTIGHLRNLDKYRPLKRFDLSVVRKINNNLHCGVCNEIFDIIDHKIHENSKKHEENLLTAINKVSDLMYDSNLHLDRKGNFHSNRNTINPDRLTSSSDRNTSSPARLTSSYDRITASYDRNSSSSDRNVSAQERLRNNGEFHFNANSINNNINNVYEESDEEFSEEDQLDEAEEATEEYSYEIEEYNTPFQGVSYASMASKPTIELPKFLKIDLGTKEVRVKFESWHMIIKIESNKFYCMVCNKKDHIRFKSQHCIGCEHVEKLAQCSVVRAFEDYLIRKVDDKLYHCGHCNNLQYQNQMEDHIESSHPKINRNFVEKNKKNIKSTKKTKTTDKSNSKTVIEPKKTESDKSAIINKNIDIEPEIEPPKFDIFGDIPLSPFGSGLKIPALNFNLIMKMDDDYYCVICDKIVADVKVHVEEMDHIELMTMTPFIKPFQNNLTRAVRGMLHCSLCNKLFPVAEVYDHNIDQPHTSALATAMGMKKTQKPVNTKRVTVLNLDSNQNQATVPTVNLRPYNLPPEHQTNSQIQNENIPMSLNQLTAQVNVQKTNAPEMRQNIQLPNSGQNAAPQNVFNAANRLNTHSQNSQNYDQGLLSLLKIGQNTGQILPNSGQNLPQPGQLSISGEKQPNFGHHLPQPGQNLPQPRQNLPQPRKNLPPPRQNLPQHGQNLPKSGQNFPFPQNHAQAIKSIPPMFNSMFPLLPPVNSQNLQNQFVGAPLMYNVNAPRRSLSPFPNLTPNHSPTLLSPNIPVNTTQNQTENNNQDTERKTIIITDRNDNSKYGIDKIRRDSDNSRSGNNNSRLGSDNTRRESVNSRPGSDNSRRDSDNSRLGRDNIRRDSDNSKSGNYNIDLSDNIETESQSEEDEYKEFDEEEMVFLKLKTTYFKITNMSYNTMVFLDNGIRYCFVCSSIVLTSQQQRHVESRKHMECLADSKFLDKYGVQLFRQMYLMYHCAICNELMTRKEIKLHLDWPIHVENYNIAHLILNKKNRKELKSGLKEYLVETQKEAIFHNVNEPNYHIRAAYQIVPNLDVKKDTLESRPAKGSKPTLMKKNKMVIQNNVVMKISFDHWHGITTAKNITKCVICQLEITPNDVLEHVETDYHAVALGKTFEKTFYPALVRKINEHTVNCMTCNLEIPNNEYMIHEHVNGRKHNKNQENIVNETSNSDSYADCYEDYLNL